MIEIYRFLLKS